MNRLGKANGKKIMCKQRVVIISNWESLKCLMTQPCCGWKASNGKLRSRKFSQFLFSAFSSGEHELRFVSKGNFKARKLKPARKK